MTEFVPEIVSKHDHYLSLLLCSRYMRPNSLLRLRRYIIINHLLTDLHTAILMSNSHFVLDQRSDSIDHPHRSLSENIEMPLYVRVCMYFMYACHHDETKTCDRSNLKLGIQCCRRSSRFAETDFAES